MKIIAGKYKGRKIELSKKVNFRPTKGKTKEAIFSILSSGWFIGKSIIDNAIILELFAGSGAYSFEALSRGAKSAILVDIDQDNIDMIKINEKNIGTQEEITIIRCDSTTLPKARIKCDLVFIDPPYHNNYLVKTLTSLKNQEWLNNNAIIVTEQATKDDFDIDKSFELITEKIYGKTKVRILKYNEL